MSTYISGLNSQLIDELLNSKLNFCPHCEEDTLKYFCIDSHCYDRELICYECRQNNIYYDHYQHEAIYLKNFLTQETFSELKRTITHYNVFTNNLVSSIEKCEKMLSHFNYLKDRLEEFKVREFQRRVEEAENKLREYCSKKKMKGKPKAKQELKMDDIFYGFQYHLSSELCQAFDDVKEKFQSIEELSQVNSSNILLMKHELKGLKFSQGKLPQEYEVSGYNKEFEKLKSEKTNLLEGETVRLCRQRFRRDERVERELDPIFNFFKSKVSDCASEEETQLRNRASESLQLKTTQDSILQCFGSFNQLKKIRISVPLDHQTLHELFLNAHSLQHIIFDGAFEKTPTYIVSIPLAHELLCVMEFNFKSKIDELFFKDFFNVEKFPCLEKLVILDDRSAAAKENFEALLSQDLSRVKSFKFVYVEADKKITINSSTNSKFIEILEKNQLNQFALERVAVTEEKREKLAAALKQSPVWYSSTWKDGQECSWRKIVYGLLKFQKYKDIAKRTFRKITRLID